MHRLHSKFWTTMLIAILLLPLGLQPIAGPTNASPSASVVIRLYVNDKAHLDAVAGELDIWEVHRDAGYVVAAVTPEQLAWLQSLGYQTVVDPEITAWLHGDRAPLDPRYYYFSEFYSNPNRRYIVNFLQGTNTAHPDLTELFDIGNAWQTTRDIWVLRITNEDAAFGPIADKPTFFLYATIHAREVSTPELAIRYIKYLLDGYNGQGGYGVDPDVTWLVDQHVLYVLVMANPDGHVVNEMNTSADRRKNMNNTSCPSGNFGVDLNRNHSFLWGCCGGSSSYSCSDIYRGVSRGSEPETQAFQAFFAQVMRDQNGPNGDDQIPPAAPENAMGIFLTLHSYSDYVLWPWGFGGYGNSPNYTQLRAIGEKFAYFNGFNPIGYIGYAVDGATDDWTYGKFGVASFTFEVGPDDDSACGRFFPAYGCIDGIDGMSRNFWAENKPAFLYAHKIAAAPYRIVYGPDALNVTLAPPAGVVGDAITVQATIADRRHGNAGLRPVTAAEVFIGAPGADGTGIPMAPVDGSWGSTSEQARATLDTSALAPGRHLVFVHGRNDQGKWGPFSTAFLDLEAPPPPCIALTDASLAALTPSPIYTGTLVAFEATLSPDDFTAPYTYTLDFGAGPGEPFTGEANPITGMTHTFASTGTHTATLTVWNCAADAGAALTATATLEVLARPITLTHGVTLTPASAAQSSFPNATISYTLTVQNTGNGTDTFDLTTTGEEAWPTAIAPNVLTLAAEASRVITVTVTLGFDVIGSDIAHIVAISRGAPTMEARATLHTTALPWKRLYLPLLVHDAP